MFSLVCQSQTPRSFGTIFRSNRLKFCEVWFNGVNLKVFDVALNAGRNSAISSQKQQANYQWKNNRFQ